jgi:hypothetical protein
MVLEVNFKPILAHTVYGMISPSTTITDVEMKNPAKPPSISDIRIEMRVLHIMIQSKIVVISRFALFLKGSTFLALMASISSYLVSKGPIVSSSRYLGSRVIIPMFNPLKKAEIILRMTIANIFHQATSFPVSSCCIRFLIRSLIRIQYVRFIYI